MTTLSTHDTKRSEDVRARLLAVAGDAESWQRCSEEFAEAARARGVDPPTAHLRLADPRRRRRDRRRAAQGLPRQGDARVQAAHLVAGLRPGVRGPGPRPGPGGQRPRPARRAGQHRRRPQRRRRSGRWCSAQKLLQLTLPGVPDTYQGCELVDLSLVDPDNRRPVDYDERASAAGARCASERAPRPDDEKLLVTHKALTLRRELRASFGDLGDYQPLVGTSRHLVGFVRGGEVATLVTRAPQAPRGQRRLGRRDGAAARGAVARRAHRGPARRCRQPARRRVRATTRWRCCDGCTCDDARPALGAARRGRRAGHRRPAAPR